MVVNGIEIEGEGIHRAILSRVADAALELGVYTVENDESGWWNGPLRLPRKIEIRTANRQLGVVFKTYLADGRSQLTCLSSEVVADLVEGGWLL
jgi:hypothetical protein